MDYGIITYRIRNASSSFHMMRATKANESIVNIFEVVVHYVVIDLDDCAVEPCLNGGKCTDRVNGFNCKCVPGYDGWNCANSKTSYT